ncbi:MAG: DUF5050 domain-containing protein, partial [Eubacteriales bacterium]|nr:DUF5050 domain-containing protein [Eubacteriales bacterium]
EEDVSEEYRSEETQRRIDSAVVSAGVNSSDLGNIMNGQYYFSTENYIFYSSYDENDNAHIYSVKKDGTEHKAIFDGFGWSLVVIDDWLYFSGNQGTEIDGTYNIFRMKLDGTQLEKLINRYSYGMFFYDNYLYYMTSYGGSGSSMSVYRSTKDGKNEEVIFTDGYSPIVYKDQLYCYDTLGNLIIANPNGTESQILLEATVKYYILSDDQIIYLDNNNNIYKCDLEGKNNVLIRQSAGIPIISINAYMGRVFFAEYDSSFDYTLYGFKYNVISCKTDGSDEKSVFSSTSYSICINLADNKLMLMDYVMNTSSSAMFTSVKSMDLNGENLQTLQR